ncbi:hypothetical protein ABW21_db0208625 [Orbilia brochopaga]|nr:hypothetical protein ABW21_db0208625 [Drechslerella brochopaga]
MVPAPSPTMIRNRVAAAVTSTAVTSSSAPAPTAITPDQSQSKSNSSDALVALAALVFAGVAFLIAFLQVLLQYLTSSQRDKCLSGAIGVWSRLVKTGWDFSRWRIRVQYPQLKFNPEKLLKHRSPWNAMDAWKQKYFPEYGMASRRSLMKRGVIKPGSSKWYLGYGGNVFIGPPRTGPSSRRQPMTFWSLSIIQKFRWLWISLRNHIDDNTHFAKAGWANVLGTLNIEVSDELIEEYEDADKIPSVVDVPIQRIQLSHLSLLCYMMNIKNIDINIDEGSIKGHNAFVKVTTEPILGLGQAIVIDGDFGSLRDEIRASDTTTVATICYIVRGGILGAVGFRGDIEYFDLDVFLYGLLKKWEQTTWTTHEVISRENNFINISGDPTRKNREGIRVSPRHQAAYYSKIYQSPQNSKSWSEIWSEGMGACTPTIIQHLGTMPFTSIWCAAPLDLFFTPFSAHLRQSRKAWWRSQRDHGGLRFLQHPQVEISLSYGSIPFLTENSDYHMTASQFYNILDRYTWITHPVIYMFQLWNSDIAKDVIGKPDDLVFTFPASVIQLLEGETIQGVRQILQETMPMGDLLRYTLESTIMLSLFMVDCRLQALWVPLDKDGALGSFYRAVRTCKGEPADPSTLAMIVKASGIGRFPDPALVHFQKFWHEIGQQADLTGETDLLQDCVTKILDSWQDDSRLCISAISPVDASKRSPHIKKERYDRYAKQLGTSPDAMTRKEFVTWLRDDIILEDGSKAGPRIDVVRKMIPLLQLRTFLMALSYECHADSSKVYLTDAEATVNVRLI